MGDFNAEHHDHFPMDFCDVYNLKNLIKVSACFKTPERPTSIDVMLKPTHTDGSSHSEVFLRKGVLKICSKFGCSPVNLLYILRTPFPKNTSDWLLLFRSFQNSFAIIRF